MVHDAIDGRLIATISRIAVYLIHVVCDDVDSGMVHVLHGAPGDDTHVV